MNPCKRCAHFIEDPYILMNSKCGHDSLKVINVITGEPQPCFCTTARLQGNKCGPDGDLWVYDDAYSTEFDL